ncbi:helix-turn-helix domain-containing protein [Luteitalea sp. TBR-22]|uniref:helix-turn-helix domain-containing protein n=1 Tax=Luteitalea sp. TBR-22 TaxID=2802971 RepID=UPI001EF52250|nr:helix-turn-helix domain-containing protein [Luteitalea sp. TBR-22]
MNEHTQQPPRRQADRRPKAARPGQRLLTFAQASTEYGPPANSLRDLVLRGKLPAVQLGSRYWLRRDDLDRLIERSVV